MAADALNKLIQDIALQEEFDRTQSLKEKIISEYTYFLNRLRMGYKESYSHILNMISYIEINEDNNFIYEKLING